MPITPCIILFRISCNFSTLCSKFHYFQNYSQDYCQNNPLTLEIMLYDYSIRVLRANHYFIILTDCSVRLYQYVMLFMFPILYYRIVGMFDRGKFGKSSIIHQTKTIQISNYN